MIADLLEVVPDRGDRGHGRQAPPGIVIVLLHEPAHQRIQQSIIVLGQGSLRLEDLTERLVFLCSAGLHRGDERVARDEVHLERQDSEEQVTVRAGLCHGRISHFGPRQEFELPALSEAHRGRFSHPV